jgi:phosphonoacetaldehyde hydrolase
VRGQPPTEADIDAMYHDLEPLALEALPRYAAPVPGLLDALAALRARGVKIGSTTGYNRAMLDRLVDAAATHGYRPDCHVAASEVPAGRPGPYMAWTAVMRLGVVEVQSCVKIGDTVVDVEEGLNAGMWSVGVAATGNEIGLDLAAFEALEPADRAARVDAARRRLLAAGAHLVVDSAAELPAVLDALEARLRAGERP